MNADGDGDGDAGGGAGRFHSTPIWAELWYTYCNRAAYIRVRSINSYAADAECPCCVVTVSVCINFERDLSTPSTK